MLSVDDEWSSYLNEKSSDFNFSIESKPLITKKPVKIEKELFEKKINTACEAKQSNKKNNYSSDCDSEDEDEYEYNGELCKEINNKNISNNLDLNNIPKCDELYISTKTKVVFLNQEIDIHKIFWNIPIIEYWKPCDGVVKKQMKIVSKTKEEFEEYMKKIENIPYYIENNIKTIDNPTARRIKFKDERKITIGVSKKDIMNCRGKVKYAFYNCFAMILRFKYQNMFREIHVKTFNTGKMEIPGILNSELLEIVKGMVINILQPYLDTKLEYVENVKNENVLINSNFNCGFYINREKLHSILCRKYRIETAYDPCSYPGVKCKFYFNNEKGFDEQIQTGKLEEDDRNMKMSELGENKKYTEVSFMVFRTGSCLIVGNCSEIILNFIYNFIKKILTDEYSEIYIQNEETPVKNKKPKIRKRLVSVSQTFLNNISKK